MVVMERIETIESPSWTGHKKSSLRCERHWQLAPVFLLQMFSRNHFPLNAGGMGGVINMKITERTQSKNGKNPLKTGHSCDAGLLRMAKRTQI
jgi:hypothetical protein